MFYYFIKKKLEKVNTISILILIYSLKNVYAFYDNINIFSSACALDIMVVKYFLT